MGVLSAYALEAILAGGRIRQDWRIGAPSSSAHTVYSWATIHRDYDPDYSCVVDPGRRKVSGYNISMAVEGDLRVGDYAITADNSSGLFYPGTADSHWSNGAYYADPQECLLEHTLWVWRVSTLNPAGYWLGFFSLTYIGRVIDVSFQDAGNTAGAVAGSCTIETENMAVSDMLRREWTEDDGDDDDTGINLYQRV